MTEQTSLGEKKQVATITLEVGKYVVHKHSSDTNEFSLLLLGYKFHEDHPYTAFVVLLSGMVQGAHVLQILMVLMLFQSSTLL